MKLNKIFYEFTLGNQLGGGTIRFILLLAIFCKTQFLGLGILVYILATIVILFLIWVIGAIMLRSGFYEEYQMHTPVYKRLLGNNKK